MGSIKVMAKRYPLPKRFSAATSEKGYQALRELNEQYHFSNNYLLTILLENLDHYADKDKLDEVFKAFIEEYGQPAPHKMKSD
jgi:negative regulator of genetic competence, sporulation and motility